jgi:hypothetical protein
MSRRLGLHRIFRGDPKTEWTMELRKIHDYLWEIPQHGEMRVPGRIYATKDLLADPKSDESLEQVCNVAHLPGIVKYSIAMPTSIGVTDFRSAV